MVGAVDVHFDRKILEKTGIFRHNGRMECITGRDTVQGISRHILQNSATEGNIDDLHALADPDHGDPGGNGCVKGLKLQDVQFGVNSTGTFVCMYQDPLVMTPSPKAVLDNIVPDFVMGYVYGALVESFCSEQNARMMAMEAANKNASAMIHDLSIQYNRVRQAMITQEITEVIAGAKAQKKKKKARKEVLNN